MVSDLKTFTSKGCKIAAPEKKKFLDEFCLTSRIFWYPHQSRDALSPVCGIFHKGLYLVLGILWVLDYIRFGIYDL